MTEAEWLKSAGATRMFRHIQHRLPSERKCRLFAVLCLRRIWHRLPDDCCRAALEVCERYIEGLASASELAAAETASNEAFIEFDDRDGWETAASAINAACTAEDVPLLAGQAAREAALLVEPTRRRTESKWQSRARRDLFGPLPFRAVTLDPVWLTTTVLALAQQMYESRDFSAMPILADALQDAGCASEEVLSHCRGPGPHVRGCWVVDLVLGKE